MSETRRCKHCRVEVEFVNYSPGPEWRHKRPVRIGSEYRFCRLTAAEPEPTPLERLVEALLEASALPPPPDAIKVAPDVAEAMREYARVSTGTCSPFLEPVLGSAFGIPVKVDEDLAPGEWRIEGHES
jgi:hypothetical protein